MRPEPLTSSPGWRILTVLILWGAALILVLVQSNALSQAAAEYKSYARGGPGIPRVPADWWRVSGVLVPLCFIACALWVQRGGRIVWLRRLSGIGLVLLIPIALGAPLLALARGPVALASVRLPGGARYILATEPIPTDTVYTLYQPIGRWGFWWRHATWLDDS